MTAHRNSSFTSTARSFSRAASVVVTLVGGLVLVGWAFDVPALKSVFPDLVAMKANTALAFILAGVSLRLVGTEETDQRTRPVAHACASAVALIGLFTLSEYLFGRDLGIDNLLFQEPLEAVQTSLPGRMAPATALCFLLVGIAVLLLDVETRRGHRPAQLLILMPALISFLALIGYAYDIQAPYGVAPYSSMALHTALTFTVLSVGVLGARPDRGLMTILTSDSAGGVIARRLLPAVIGDSVALGWLTLAGQRAGLYDAEFGLALLVGSSIVLFAIVVWWNARSLDRMDIERKRTESKFRGLLESAPDAIVVVDSAGRIVLVNLQTEQMFGHNRDELLGQPVETLLPEHFREVHVGYRAGYIAHPRTRTMGSGLDLAGRRKNGSEFPVDVSLSPLETEQGILVISSIRDITERKQAEEALREKSEEVRAISQQLWQTAKLATMGELTASIAHELNNPLATVSLRVESLLMQLPTDDSKRRALEIIQQEVERMSTLVVNLLQTSRRASLQISTLDVREEIAKTLELMQYHLRNRRITMVQEFAPDVPLIQADRQQLRQLFLNLFTNASDATPQGGTLTIRVGVTEERVVIEVTDTGVGIAPEDLPHVMEPFFTTKPEGRGTGLGLAICRRIVHEHQGTLEIASGGLGKGTTVYVTLPSRNGENGKFLREL
ncbi:MAG: PAS domain S-box protein [Deltaproteobacteria bacterium]|nr:PAS domain S-box protein [Deltaproteobacteria bacterium]